MDSLQSQGSSGNVEDQGMESFLLRTEPMEIPQSMLEELAPSILPYTFTSLPSNNGSQYAPSPYSPPTINNSIPLAPYSIHYDDVINKIPDVSTQELEDAMERMRIIEGTFKQELKPEIHDPLGPKVLVEARYMKIVPWLDCEKHKVRVKCVQKLLAVAVLSLLLLRLPRI